MLSVVSCAGGLVVAGATPSIALGYQQYLPRDLSPTRAIFTGPDPGVATISGVVGTRAAVLSGVPNSDLAQQVDRAIERGGMAVDLPIVERVMSSTRRTSGDATLMGVALYLPQGVGRVGYWSSPGDIIWFDPPLIELPQNPIPGTTWQGRGLVSGAVQYELDGRIHDAGRVGSDCIRAETRFRQQALDGSWTSIDNWSTWCPGRGIVATGSPKTGESMTIVEGLPPAQPSLAAGDHRAPAPAVGAYSLPGLVQVSQPAVILDELVVVADAVSDDVMAFRIPRKDPAEQSMSPGQQLSTTAMEVAWVQHPGGSILGLATDGERIVVSTSKRRLVAFDVMGQVLWQTEMPDITVGPVAFGDRILAAASVGGSWWAFDPASGVLRWQDRTPELVDLPVAVRPSTMTGGQPGHVAVADVAGNVRVRSTDGLTTFERQEASQPVMVSILADGGTVIGGGDQTLRLIESDLLSPSKADGAPAGWESSLPSVATGQPASIADLLVIPTRTALTALDRASGAVRWIRPDLGAAQVRAVEGRILGVAGNRLFELDPNGDLVSGTDFASDGPPARRVYLLQHAGAPADSISVISDDGRVRVWAGDGRTAATEATEGGAGHDD